MLLRGGQRLPPGPAHPRAGPRALVPSKEDRPHSRDASSPRPGNPTPPCPQAFPTANQHGMPRQTDTGHAHSLTRLGGGGGGGREPGPRETPCTRVQVSTGKKRCARLQGAWDSSRACMGVCHMGRDIGGITLAGPSARDALTPSGRWLLAEGWRNCHETGVVLPLPPFAADRQKRNPQCQLCCPRCWSPAQLTLVDTWWAMGPALDGDGGRPLSWGSLPHRLFPEYRKKGCFRPEGWGQRFELGAPAGDHAPHGPQTRKSHSSLTR